jgi:hypothetical protein
MSSNFRYYLKKLTSNELGYRNNRLVTGQIFYLSKQAIEFFPPLSPQIHNDSIGIEITVEYRPSPVTVNLVFHNDKYSRSEGTRDEYRIYLNRDIAPDDFFFRPGDIIIFEKKSLSTYNLSLIKPSDSKYLYFEKLIKDNFVRGSHALVENLY